MRKALVAVLFVVFLHPRVGSAAKFEIDPVHSSIEFSIRHMVGNVKGNFTKFSGTINFDEKSPVGLKAEAAIEAGSLDTRNERRNEHLMGPEFFDVAKYPDIKFKSRKVTAKSKNRLKVVGDLTLHGVTKPVTLDVTYNGTVKDPWFNTRAAFTGATKLDRKRFGINYSKLLDKGIPVVGDEVTISLEIEAIVKK